MDLNLTTPAILFSTLSLLLLAYTNRFLGLASRIRDLHSKYSERPDKVIKEQIESLRYRVVLIKHMQLYGILSLFMCTLCMFVLFAGWVAVGKVIFGLSLILLLISLGISIREIQISVHALNLALLDMEGNEPPKRMG